MTTAIFVRLLTARKTFFLASLLLVSFQALLAEETPAASREEAKAPPPYEKQVNLVYTVNNFGYTDTCG